MKQTILCCLLAAFFLTACSSSGENDSTNPSNNAGNPALLSWPGSHARILDSEQLIFIFSESIDVNSLTMEGDIQLVSTQTWSSSASANDTLTFTPQASTWPLSNTTLTMRVNDLQGNASDPISVEVSYVSQVFYVSPTGILDGPGTKTQPKLNIQNAIDASTGSAVIRLAVGRYDINAPINLAADISLDGGYSADFNRRNPAQYQSHIIDDRPDIMEAKKAIVSTGTSAETSQISGLTVELQNDVGSTVLELLSGISLRNSAVIGGFYAIDNSGISIIENSEIVGRDGDTCRVVYNRIAASIQLTANTIQGCRGSRNTTVYNASTATAVLIDNIIQGGTSSFSASGIHNAGTITELSNNTVIAPTVTLRTTSIIGGTVSYGIRNTGSILKFSGNNIDGGQGGDLSYGLSTNHSGGNMLVENNRINGGFDVRKVTTAISSSKDLELVGNEIFGGRGNLVNKSYTVRFSGAAPPNSATLKMRNNIVHTGSTNNSYGIFMDNGVVIADIFNNLFYAAGGGIPVYAIGTDAGFDINLQNNTLYFETGKGLHNMGDSNFNVDNNLFYASNSAICIDSQRAGSVLTSIGTNNFFGCSSIINYRGTVVNDLVTVFDGISTLAELGNISVDFNFANLLGDDGDINATADNDWRPAPGSDANILSGGADLSPSLPSVDYTGVSERTGNGTTGWTMGAYEVDLL